MFVYLLLVLYTSRLLRSARLKENTLFLCTAMCRDSVKRRSLDTLHSAIPSSDPIYTVHPGLPNSLKEGQVGV